MDPVKGDGKLSAMIMCGDHPSVTKTELNVREDKESLKERIPATFAYARMSPSSSRTARPLEREASGEAVRAGSEAVRAGGESVRAGGEAVRAGGRRYDLDLVPYNNRALVQAALGSSRWPPYLLAAWVLVLLVTHVLHGLTSLLERTLPKLRKFCQYFKSWTEEAWRSEREINQKVYPMVLALVTGLLYTLYFGLYVIFSVAVWSIEPLCIELDDKLSNTEVLEAKVTNYDEMGSKLICDG